MLGLLPAIGRPTHAWYTVCLPTPTPPHPEKKLHFSAFNSLQFNTFISNVSHKNTCLQNIIQFSLIDMLLMDSAMCVWTP